MRHLVLSDLHANREALDAVLRHAAGAYDRVVVLGDIVGYGADPAAVVAALRSIPGLAAVRGNHDKVAAGIESGAGFNEAALAAVRWTARTLAPDDLAYLGALPRGPLEFAPGCFLSHGTPLDEDRYLLDEGEARRCFDRHPFRLCFFGHTHLPCLYEAGETGPVRWLPARGERTDYALRPDRRHLVNPGSVGQPRDRDPRASCAIYDDAAATVTVLRVPYPLEETRRRILDAGLPAWLGDRLRGGV